MNVVRLDSGSTAVQRLDSVATSHVQRLDSGSSRIRDVSGVVRRLSPMVLVENDMAAPRDQERTFALRLAEAVRTEQATMAGTLRSMHNEMARLNDEVQRLQKQNAAQGAAPPNSAPSTTRRVLSE